MYTKLIDWDTFRDICKYRDKKTCNAKEFGVSNCSQSNRGAMNQCGFWKILRSDFNYSEKEKKDEELATDKRKKFREWDKD